MTTIISYLFQKIMPVTLPLCSLFSTAQPQVEPLAQYTSEDSIKVEQLLTEGDNFLLKDSTSALILYYARALQGIPYVAQTLEHNSDERLVINLQQLDCTTFVENVLALYRCTKNHQTSFADFTHQLRSIRYENGEVHYTRRNHYFTGWIASNTHNGFVKEVQSRQYPFTRIQNVQVNWMRTHTDSYPMLVKHPDWVAKIAQMERKVSNHSYRYIPKENLKSAASLRRFIRDGDILAITTKKKGLDTSHIGLAIWHKDGLHLFNASMLHMKVVDEPKLLYTYMQEHPSQEGIRVIRVK